MNRFAAKYSWITAVASFAMLLAVQTLHSPLQHALECTAAESTPPALVADPSASTCGHVHRHGKHVHTHADCAAAHDHSAPGHSHEHSHQHSHDCPLCQVSSQALQLVAPPVPVIGEEIVAAAPEAIAAAVFLVALTGPHVRGPPQLG